MLALGGKSWGSSADLLQNYQAFGIKQFYQAFLEAQQIRDS